GGTGTSEAGTALTSTFRTAGCGPACPVVWEGSSGITAAPYPDSARKSDAYRSYYPTGPLLGCSPPPQPHLLRREERQRLRALQQPELSRSQLRARCHRRRRDRRDGLRPGPG